MSQTVVALPRLIELRSVATGKLLRYVKEEGVVKGYVQFSGEHVGSADVKFEVHSSTAGDGLVHIRSCYNNKYLQDTESYINWTLAKAEKPEEDQSKRSCTLLRPTSVDGNPKKIRLTNVHNENHMCLWYTYDEYNACVLTSYSDPDPNLCDVFEVIDWESLVILPKYVAFKGDNDKFLRAITEDGQYFLQFSQTKVEDDPKSATNEIVPTSNTYICIRNMHFDRFWAIVHDRWIKADEQDTRGNITLFEAVKCGKEKVAIKNVITNLFCTRLSRDGRESYLNANSETINSWAQFEVSEPVISRKTENINFRLMDARIYGESIDQMSSSSHTNAGSETQEFVFDLAHKVTKSSTWNSNVSVKASLETTFDVGIPFIENTEIKLGFEIAGAYTWGEAKETTDEVSVHYTVKIPPKTKVTARLMSTRGTCDVPFSYTQRDVLYNGETVTTEMDDGVYTGANNFSYYTELKEESLIRPPKIRAQGFNKVALVSPSGVITPI